MKKNDTTYDYTATAAQEEEGLHAAEPTATHEAAPLYKGRSLQSNSPLWHTIHLQEDEQGRVILSTEMKKAAAIAYEEYERGESLTFEELDRELAPWT